MTDRQRIEERLPDGALEVKDIMRDGDGNIVRVVTSIVHPPAEPPDSEASSDSWHGVNYKTVDPGVNYRIL